MLRCLFFTPPNGSSTGRGRTTSRFRSASKLALIVLLLCGQEILATETLGFVVKSPLYRTNLGVNNLDPTPADLRVSLYDNAGTLLAQSNLQIAGLGFINVTDVVSFLVGFPYELSFEGFIQVESAANIFAFGAQIFNETNDPGFIASVRRGAARLLLPVTSSIDPWRSSLSITNLSSIRTTVSISLWESNGTLKAAMETTLEPSSQWSVPDIHQQLGVDGVRGPIEIQSLDGASLAVVCRHKQAYTQQTVFQQAFDVNNAGKTFYLPYVTDAGLQRNWAILNNPGQEPASVTLFSFSAEGILIGETSSMVPARGSVQLSESELFPGSSSPYGLICGNSNVPICGLAINTDLATGDTIHTNLVTELSPELLISAVTNTGAFSSGLLVSNLGEMDSTLQLLSRKTDGSPSAAALTAPVPARGTIQLEKVLPALGVRDGFGPLAIRSVVGQPIIAFSQVAAVSGLARGSLNALDSRPVTVKRPGEPLKLRWEYDRSEISKILEYRLYRADRVSRRYERIASVPAGQLEFSLQVGEPGDFVLIVRAFDGELESDPSNEVILQVKP
jgi:hypothetical protein